MIDKKFSLKYGHVVYKRFLICAPKLFITHIAISSGNAGNRRVSFGGALRLKKFEKFSQDKPEFPKFTPQVKFQTGAEEKPDFTPATPVKKLVQQFNQSVSLEFRILSVIFITHNLRKRYYVNKILI